jgi:hypothetical protein
MVEEKLRVAELIEAERETLALYLDGTGTGIRLENISVAMGEHFNRFLEGMAVMSLMSAEALKAARAKDIHEVGRLMGAGAKVQKDGIYGVLIESAGGIQNFLQTGVKGNFVILREYIMHRYETAVRQCEGALVA